MAGNDDFVNRAARGALNPKQPNITVAAPLNDFQLLSMVAAEVYSTMGGVNAARHAVAEAVEIMAHAAVAVKSGDLLRTMQKLLDEQAVPAGPSLVGH
jgi:hypothetical protein